MLLYIDYLDYTTSHSSTFSEVDKRLRFDLLIYSGGDTLCISVPACVKLGSTTKLLMQLDQFWKKNKILLQLDKKHKGNVCNYFRNRKRVLEKSIHEEELIQHFEYKAYQSGRIQTFFENYLFQGLKIQSADIFINKINDTDALFRKECVNLFEKNTDGICHNLDYKRAIKFGGISYRICDYASDKTMLFQRAVIEKKSTINFSLT